MAGIPGMAEEYVRCRKASSCLLMSVRKAILSSPCKLHVQEEKPSGQGVAGEETAKFLGANGAPAPSASSYPMSPAPHSYVRFPFAPLCFLGGAPKGMYIDMICYSRPLSLRTLLHGGK